MAYFLTLSSHDYFFPAGLIKLLKLYFKISRSNTIKKLNYNILDIFYKEKGKEM